MGRKRAHEYTLHLFFADLVVMRFRTGITQTVWASMMGVSSSSVSAWESGKKSIPLARLERYADLLGYKITMTLERKV